MERRIAWYEATLEELDELAQTQPFAGPSGFFGWERLKGLLHQLRAAFDRYELEGDVAPVRQQIEAYYADLAMLQVRQDARVNGVLERFLAVLEAPALELRVSQRDPVQPSVWPPGTLTITPEELLALHEALQPRQS